MKYGIELIFVIFPIICLIFALCGKKGKFQFWFLTIAFILLYTCSKNGSDFEGYRELYESVQKGQNIFQIHGEPGYGFLMSVSSGIGLSYFSFRVLFLGISSFVLFREMEKLGNNFALSLYIVTTMFVVYTISAYRQFFVMAFSLYWLDQYMNGKKVIAILGTAFLLLFHVTALISVFLLLAMTLFGEQRVRRECSWISQNIIVGLVLAFSVRIVIYILLQSEVLSGILKSILTNHASIEPSTVTSGLLSRTVFFILLSYLFAMVKPENRIVSMLFWCYSIGILLYIAVPLDYFMGRLANNVSIYSAVLIPLLIQSANDAKHGQKIVIGRNCRLVLSCLMIIAFVILINQLTHQDGYYPYVNQIINF